MKWRITMAVDTNKSVEAESAAATSASAKPQTPKPAARPRAVKATAPATATPARKRTPVAAKAVTAAAKKTVTPPAARTSPPAKKIAHESEPPVAKSNKADKPTKVKKAKLVRDSFTMPEGEYALIATLKKRCLNAGVSAKKSELLRAAVANLAKLSDASVVAALRRLEVIKTGRPAKGAK
jgi:hypothetical protein